LSALDRHLGGAESNLVWDLINIVLVRLFGRLFIPRYACLKYSGYAPDLYQHRKMFKTLIAPELGSLERKPKGTTPSNIGHASERFVSCMFRLSELS
jgi:hypothetical protein